MDDQILDLSKDPIVDSHCHAFLPDKETKSFEQYLTLSDLNVPKEDMFNTFLYRQVVHELSRVLDFKGKHEEIVKERTKRYKKDPVSYIKLLYDDANIETLLIDTGTPNKEESGYSIDLDEFSKIVPCKIREIFRIDNILFSSIKNQTSFDTTVEHFHDQIDKAINRGSVGLKSTIAYSTGLEVQRNSEDGVQKAYGKLIDEYRLGKSVSEILFKNRTKQLKTVMDYFVFLGVEDSVKLGVPFQIHTGMGDSPEIDMRTANPILLYELINDKSSLNAKIVLTHGGYPWIEEAGFLVNSYPNVFIDLSETMPFISLGIKEKLLNIFEMAPTNKIMYGSDGYNIPELHWISAIQAKKALSATINELLKTKEIDEDWAYEIAKQVLSLNAQKIYNLNTS